MQRLFIVFLKNRQDAVQENAIKIEAPEVVMKMVMQSLRKFLH
jgi:hypothetical protein